MKAYEKQFSHDHVAVGPRRGGSYTPTAEVQREVEDALLGQGEVWYAGDLARWAKEAQPGDRFSLANGTFITCW